MARPSLLVAIFVVWAVTCVGIGAAVLRRGPAVSLALLGSVVGAVAGFLVGNADGPAGVPAATAVGASVGLVANGAVGLLGTSARPPSEPLKRAAIVVFLAAPLAAMALTLLLRDACPLYVTGKGSGFCNFRQVDVLGGWISEVVVTFLFDAVFVAALLLVPYRQARVREETIAQAIATSSLSTLPHARPAAPYDSRTPAPDHHALHRSRAARDES